MIDTLKREERLLKIEAAARDLLEHAGGELVPGVVVANHCAKTDAVNILCSRADVIALHDALEGKSPDEITLDMIEAGTEVLGMYDPAEDGVTGWAEDIYREMERVRRLGESQPSHVSSSLHYGPRWFWDQSRPEAIRARAQMAEDYKKLPFARPMSDDSK